MATLQSVTVTIPAGTFSSTTSQAAADALALAAARAQAEAQLNCTVACPQCPGEPITEVPVPTATVTIPAGQFSSPFSQAAADALALAAARSQAQAQLDCTVTCPECPDGDGNGEEECPIVWRVAYWPCEVLVGDSMLPDSAGNFELPTISNAGIGSAGIIGNCLALEPPATVENHEPCFEFSGHSFSIRLWMRDTYVLEVGTKWLTRNRSLVQRNWTLQRIGAVSSTVPKYHLFFSVPGVGSIFTPTIDWDGFWHRLIAWHDMASGQIGLRLDESTVFTSSAAGTMTPSSKFFTFGSFGDIYSGFAMDEVGLWKDYIFPEADANNDWNGGAGRTWPDVPFGF